jgi:hypothetical protein
MTALTFSVINLADIYIFAERTLQKLANYSAPPFLFQLPIYKVLEAEVLLILAYCVLADGLPVL